MAFMEKSTELFGNLKVGKAGLPPLIRTTQTSHLINSPPSAIIR
jgi:hypothetical protein